MTTDRNYGEFPLPALEGHSRRRNQGAYPTAASQGGKRGVAPRAPVPCAALPRKTRVTASPVGAYIPLGLSFSGRAEGKNIWLAEKVYLTAERGLLNNRRHFI